MVRYVFAFLALAGCAPNGEQAGNTNQQVDVALRAAQSGLPPPEAYIRPEDQERARRYDPNDIPCTSVRTENGSRVIAGLATDECFHMLPQQRYKGVWINEFEGSRFYPDRLIPPSSRDEARIWLDVERVSLRNLEPDGRAYVVEFDGRRTMYPGPFGHMGSADYELIVDRMISAIPIHQSAGR